MTPKDLELLLKAVHDRSARNGRSVRITINCVPERAVASVHDVTSGPDALIGMSERPSICHALGRALIEARDALLGEAVEGLLPHSDADPPPLLPTRGEDLKDKTVLLSGMAYKGTWRDRLFHCESGFGCNPKASGTAVFGRFVCDGERTRVERYEALAVVDTSELVEGEGSSSRLPSDWRCPICRTPHATVDGNVVRCVSGHESM